MLLRRSKTKFFHPEGAYVTSSNFILAAQLNTTACQVPGIPLFLRIFTTSGHRVSNHVLRTSQYYRSCYEGKPHPCPRQLPHYASVLIRRWLWQLHPLAIQRSIDLLAATQTALRSWHNTHLFTRLAEPRISWGKNLP